MNIYYRNDIYTDTPKIKSCTDLDFAWFVELGLTAL